MTKTCFRGGGTKAHTGARAAEYGAISRLSECSQVVLRTLTLESDLCPTYCAIRTANAGGRGWGGGGSPMISEVVGQHESEPITCSQLGVGECSAHIFMARSVRGAHLLIRAYARSDAPHASVRSAMVELKHVYRTCVPRVLRSPVL